MKPPLRSIVSSLLQVIHRTRGSQRRRVRSTPSVVAQVLEHRVLLATVTWQHNAGTPDHNFDTAANWAPDEELPGPADTAQFNNADFSDVILTHTVKVIDAVNGADFALNFADASQIKTAELNVGGTTSARLTINGS
jgi:hypothetical protein